MASSQRGDSLRSAFPLSPPLVSFILFPFIRSAPKIVVSFKTLMSPDLPPLSALLAPSPVSNPNKGAKTGSLTKLKNQVLHCSAAYCASEKARSSCQIFMQALFLFYFKFGFDQKRGWGREGKKKKGISLEATIHYSELPASFSCSLAGGVSGRDNAARAVPAGGGGRQGAGGADLLLDATQPFSLPKPCCRVHLRLPWRPTRSELQPDNTRDSSQPYLFSNVQGLTSKAADGEESTRRGGRQAEQGWEQTVRGLLLLGFNLLAELEVMLRSGCCWGFAWRAGLGRQSSPAHLHTGSGGKRRMVLPCPPVSTTSIK